MKEVFYKRNKTLILIPFIIKHKIVGMIVFEQRYCDDVLSLYMLFDDKICKMFVNALKFGIEGSIVELNLFDDRGAFNVVVVRCKL